MKILSSYLQPIISIHDSSSIRAVNSNPGYCVRYDVSEPHDYYSYQWSLALLRQQSTVSMSTTHLVLLLLSLLTPGSLANTKVTQFV